MMQTQETLDVLFKASASDTHHYLIVNRNPINPLESLANIQSCCRNKPSQYAMLYLKTDLAQLSDISPYVVGVRQGDKLLSIFERNAITGKAWSGILISVSETVTFDALLKHLRQRIYVTFASNRKGILHFSTPVTAHYFCGETKEELDTQRWLGPIKSISWYGPKNTPNDGEWCTLQNTLEKPDEDTSAWVVTPSQDEALATQNIDKTLADYFSTSSVKAENRPQWLIFRRLYREAISLGIMEQENLYQFLSVCGTHSFVRRHKSNLNNNFRAVSLKERSPEETTSQPEHRTEDRTLLLTAHLMQDKAFLLLSEQNKLSHIRTLIAKDI